MNYLRSDPSYRLLTSVSHWNPDGDVIDGDVKAKRIKIDSTYDDA